MAAVSLLNLKCKIKPTKLMEHFNVLFRSSLLSPKAIHLILSQNLYSGAHQWWKLIPARAVSFNLKLLFSISQQMWMLPKLIKLRNRLEVSLGSWSRLVQTSIQPIKSRININKMPLFFRHLSLDILRTTTASWLSHSHHFLPFLTLLNL